MKKYISESGLLTVWVIGTLTMIEIVQQEDRRDIYTRYNESKRQNEYEFQKYNLHQRT